MRDKRTPKDVCGEVNERVAQFNLEWIFSKLDSGFQSLVGFRILSAGFRIPKPRIPDSTSKKFLDSRNPDSLTWGESYNTYCFVFMPLLLLSIK